MQAVTITQITAPELETLIENSVRKILSSQPTSPPQPPTDELLTIQQAAEFLSLSVPTLYTMVHKGSIPVMKRSKRLYFSRTELLEYLKQGRKKTLVEIASEADTYLSNHKKRLNNGK